VSPGARAIDSTAENDAAIDALANLIRGKRVVVLIGAGVSTESGIPDYRSPEAAARARRRASRKRVHPTIARAQ
jgi:hypothetical protein